MASKKVPTTRVQPLPQQISQPLSHRTNEMTTGVQPISTSQTTHPIGEVPSKVHPTGTTLPAAIKTHPTSVIGPATSRPLMRGDHHMFSTSDDSAMVKQILATHAPDGCEFDVKPVLLIIKDIMHRAASNLPSLRGQIQAHVDAWDEKATHSGSSDVLELLAYPINKIFTEMIYKCFGGGDAHSITKALFHSLSSYSWEVKVAITFAAFAVYYGEFWLVAHLHTTNPLAKSVAILMELPEKMEHGEALKQKFKAVNNLIRAMLDVTDCIIKFKELPSQYISSDSPEMISAVDHIPTAAYWTIRSIVACATLLMNLIAMDHEYVGFATEAWDPTGLAHKLADVKQRLESNLHSVTRK